MVIRLLLITYRLPGRKASECQALGGSRNKMRDEKYKAIIIGAGPAGLTAAYELTKHGLPSSFSRPIRNMSAAFRALSTISGYRFDIGGHRFFSKSREVEDLWTEILGSEMLDRPRSSKIYYRGQFYSYPLKPLDALSKLGFIESTLCVLSYLYAKVSPTRDPQIV